MEIILLSGIRRDTAMISVTLLLLCGMVVNGRPRHEKAMEKGAHRDIGKIIRFISETGMQTRLSLNTAIKKIVLSLTKISVRSISRNFLIITT